MGHGDHNGHDDHGDSDDRTATVVTGAKVATVTTVATVAVVATLTRVTTVTGNTDGTQGTLRDMGGHGESSLVRGWGGRVGSAWGEWGQPWPQDPWTCPGTLTPNPGVTPGCPCVLQSPKGAQSHTHSPMSFPLLSLQTPKDPKPNPGVTP